MSRTTYDTSLPELRRTGDLYMMLATGIACTGLLWLGWRFDQMTFGIAAAVIAGGLAGGLFMLARGSWFNSVAFPVLLASTVAAQIQMASGRTEYHFGVFVVLGFMLAYRHWLPIVTAAGVFAVHHILFDRLQAMGFPVFCQTKPDFLGVLEHASYVVVQAGIALMMAHQMRQAARTGAELDHMTRSLSSTAGKVDFTGLADKATTPAGEQLLGVLKTVHAATALARETAESVKTASAEIATGNQDLSSRTETTAADLQRTAAALEELTESVQASTQTLQAASTSAHTAASHAGEGEAAVEHLSQSMRSIATASSRVAEVTSVIDGIAFQTNILALNAAVEAARAGEAGRGFAVVAAEVRSLAQRSAEAAREIKTLVASSAEEVERGSAVGEQTRAALTAITTEVRRVNAMLSEVAGAAQEQTRGIADVNQAVASLDKSTQQNAALVEEASAAAEGLRTQAAQLAQAMQAFQTEGPAAVTAPVAVAVTVTKAPAAPMAPVVRTVAKPVAVAPAPRPAVKVAVAETTAPVVSPRKSEEDDWETF